MLNTLIPIRLDQDEQLGAYLCKSLIRYWNTLRHLKLVQIYGRLWFKLRRPRIDCRAPPPQRLSTGPWSRCAARSQSLIGPDTFLFLNRSETLEKIGWDASVVEKLWRYNQHYFDDLNAEGALKRTAWHLALLKNWMQHNPVGQGTGWEPYPLSLRIVNWVKWTLAGNPMPVEGLHSLAIQARWLTKRLESHLLGNHYFSNAKALVFVGLMFEGAEAQIWLKKGLAIIAQQLHEQVLPDGGNFERSPMYHSIFFEDLLDLINVAQACPAQIGIDTIETWRETAARMGTWLMGMVHPDGQIALFNDAAFGVTPTPAELISYADRLAVPVAGPVSSICNRVMAQQWPDSGYIRLVAKNAVALLDVAPIGPDYLPSHANADTLSFELSLFGQRVIVNGGTSRYGSCPQRLAERQTAAHSTVEIDGQSSSEVWGGFRVARRAYPFGLSMNQREHQISIGCSHNGYQRLLSKPIHRRQWEFAPNSLTVTDCVSGRFKEGIARYLFHPDLTLTVISPASVQISLPNAKIVNMTILAGTARLVVGQHSAEFGRVRQTQCLEVELSDNTATVKIEWSNE